MKFVLNFVLSGEFHATSKNYEITDLDNKLEVYFRRRNYGDVIKKYVITIMCVHPKYDDFFKEMRPRYTDEKWVKSLAPQGRFRIYRLLDFSLKLDFETFINSNTEDGLKIIAIAIIDKVSTMKYPAKTKGFDKELFFEDLKRFFKRQMLI